MVHTHFHELITGNGFRSGGMANQQFREGRAVYIVFYQMAPNQSE